MAKTVLITGNAGLLGGRLSSWILEHTHYSVIGIDDLSGGVRENIHPGTIFYQRDLAEGVDDIFLKHKPCIVYHFAAYAAEGLSPFMRRFNYRNNLVASAGLISSAIQHDVERFVFASSMAVYGKRYDPPFDESLIPYPMDPYGIAKYAVEMDLRVASEQHGLNYTVVRPHNFYGVGQNIWDRYRNVIGIWMYQLIHGLRPTIYGDGSQTRAFSYVDDALPCFWRASQQENCIGETINIGGFTPTTILDCCKTLIEVTGLSFKPYFLEPRHEAHDAFTTYDKSVKLLGFSPKTTLHDGLTEMWEWARVMPDRLRKSWMEYEMNKNLYEFWK